MGSAAIELRRCNKAQKRRTCHCDFRALRPELRSLVIIVRRSTLLAHPLGVVSVALLEGMRKLGIQTAQIFINAALRIISGIEDQRPCINALANLSYRRQLDRCLGGGLNR